MRPTSPAVVGDPEPPRYDLSYRDEFWRLRDYDDRCDRLAIRALLPDSGGHLVDLGAGFGRLVDEYSGFEDVTLVDASPTMLEAARAHIGSDPRIFFTGADANHLPIPAASADVVIAVRLLVHVADPREIFREIARVLVPGGTLILEFPNRRHLLASLRYLARRQAWSPRAPEPHEYLDGHFAHHPATVETQLRDTGFSPDARRSVSLFRFASLKRRVPAPVLARIEAPLQRPLGRLAPGPSVYLRAVRSVRTERVRIKRPRQGG
jgi:ubiquinone/menaquinone biosynthesis C-methylase UbiE